MFESELIVQTLKYILLFTECSEGTLEFFCMLISGVHKTSSV